MTSHNYISSNIFPPTLVQHSNATLNCTKIRNLIWFTSDSIPNTRTLCRTFVSSKLQRGNFQLVEPWRRVSLWKANRPMNTQESTSSTNRIFPFLNNKHPPIVKLANYRKNYLLRILYALRFDWKIINYKTTH